MRVGFSMTGSGLRSQQSIDFGTWHARVADTSGFDGARMTVRLFETEVLPLIRRGSQPVATVVS